MRSLKLETGLPRRVLVLALVVALLASLFGSMPLADAQTGTTHTRVELHSGIATIIAPRADTEWHDFVERTLIDDLPVLEDLVGLPWPVRRKLIVTQIPAENTRRIGGSFSPSSATVEIVPAINQEILLHELSHAWFNHDTLAENWMTEGLADEFASRAVAATTGVLTDPTPPDLSSPHWVPLTEWQARTAQPPAERVAFTSYQYNASWWVFRTITTEIGLNALSEVLAELDIGGPLSRKERLPRLPDWRTLYNALDGRMDREQLTTLFSTYVTRSFEEFDRRNALVDRYDELFDGSSLQPSPTLVEALDLWWLRDAEAILNAAGPSMPALEELAERAQRLGITSDGAARQLFEAATGSKGLLPLRTLIADEQADLDAIEQGRAALQAKADENTVAIEFSGTTIAQALADLPEVEAALDAKIERKQSAAGADVEVDVLHNPDEPERADSSLASAASAPEAGAPVAVIAVVTRSNGLLFGFGLAVIAALLLCLGIAFTRERQSTQAPERLD